MVGGAESGGREVSGITAKTKKGSFFFTHLFTNSSILVNISKIIHFFFMYNILYARHVFKILFKIIIVDLIIL